MVSESTVILGFGEMSWWVLADISFLNIEVCFICLPVLVLRTPSGVLRTGWVLLCLGTANKTGLRPSGSFRLLRTVVCIALRLILA